MTTSDIVHAGPADLDKVADLIGTAFADLAVAAWLVPDAPTRAAILAANVRLHVEHALTHGEIHRTGDHTAVAVWVHRDHPAPAPADYDTHLEAACGRYTDRFRILDFLFDVHHPDTQPHHHLAFLAVHPDLHGQGRGSALLRHHHRALDAARLPAYLEASSARSRDLYARHGYHVSNGSFRLPDGPPLWPMWRPPSQPAPPAPASEQEPR